MGSFEYGEKFARKVVVIILAISSAFCVAVREAGISLIMVAKYLVWQIKII